mmetsp:Transcript_44806/g.59510  ORF Transcript_44806/g.59510 Transcript_44806/m.59510 type:complete len:127 (+) Transcript_44806:167-547(+)
MGEKIKSATIETVFLVQKVMQIIAAVFIVPFAFARLSYMENLPDLLITAYFEMFAAMFIMVEFNLWSGRLKFYFLNSSLGKGLFHVFLFLFCYSNGRNGAIWIDVFLSIIFFFFSVIFLLMHCIFK